MTMYSDRHCTGSAPMVIGTARGLRSFVLDERGLLRGVTYREVWRPGENVATCYRVAYSQVPMKSHTGVYDSNAYYAVVGGIGFRHDPDVPPEVLPGYRAAACEGVERECSCGFYAYHSIDHTPYGSTSSGPKVEAVIEAYGKLVLGNLGYRAQKARIVAAVVPNDSAEPRRAHIRGLIDELNTALKRTRRRGPALGTCVFTALALAFAALGVRQPFTAPYAWFGAGFVLTAAGIYERLTRERNRLEADEILGQLEKAHQALAEEGPDYAARIAAMQANYPDIEYFPDLASLRKAYPVESLRHLVEDEGVDE